jgi:serine phosphatase RsbU (regulator of sigma subunit)
MPRTTNTTGLLGLTSVLAAAGDPVQILDVMSESCPGLLGADLVNISLLDREGATLRLVSSINTPVPVAHEFASYPLEAPLPTRDALTLGKPVVLRSVQERDERYPALAGMAVAQTAFCVLPLRSGGHRVGALGLGWQNAEDMTDDVLALSEAVASVCANALHRALAAGDEAAARQRSDRALGRLRALQDVAAELAHTFDIGQAADVVLKSVVATLAAEAASFDVFDDRGTTCTRVADLGLETTALSTRSTWDVLGSSLAQELLRTGLPILIGDSDTRRARFPDLDSAGVEQEAWATLLLRSGDAALGMISFGWREPRTFEAEDVALLQSLADHLAAAVDRARLIDANTALLEDRTRIASALQKSLLPAPLPVWPGLSLAAGYEPAELGTEVCGDFYDAFLDHEGSLIVVIGDVAGRGVAAAGLTGMARHTLRALAREMSPPDALSRLNEMLVDTAPGEEPRLLTAAALCLNRTEQGVRADIAIAGHCMPILVRDGCAVTVGSPGMILGASPEAQVGTTTIDLVVGDLLLLHTDGVIEARRNGVDFGEARLLRLLSAMSTPRPTDTVDQVLSAVRWYRTTTPDDTAVVALRVEGTLERA